MKLIISIIIFFPIHILWFLIPKNKNIWIFWSWEWQIIRDNSYFLFSYIKKDHTYIKAIFITKNKKLVHKNNGIFYAYSIKWILYQLFWKKYFLTTWYSDLSIFSYLSPLKSTYIQLWHWTPTKQIKVFNWSLTKKIIHLIFQLYLGRKYDYISSTGPLSSKLLSEYFWNERFLELWFPRNDLLMREGDVKKQILFASTFRPYNFDIYKKIDFKKINLLLGEKWYKLIIKVHPHDKNIISKKINKYENICIDYHTDIYTVLSESAILITDYSSIYIDYLIKNRPIIFTLFDYNKYLSKVWLLINKNNFPWEVVCNSFELIDTLTKILNGIDNFKIIREKSINDYYKNIPQFACKDITEYFLSK